MSDIPAFVLAARSKDPSRPKLADPFVFGSWTIATNGWILAAARGDFGVTAGPPFDPKNIALLLNDDGYVAEPLDLAALQAWLGKDEVIPECEVCRGAGAIKCKSCNGFGLIDCECDCGHEHEADCEVCDGEGTNECPSCLPSARRRDYAVIFDTKFDRSVLRPVIQHLPSGEATWSRHPTDKRKFVRITGGDEWLVIVMPVEDYVTVPKGNAVFPVPTAAQQEGV